MTHKYEIILNGDVVFLGPPASGKGTQANLICKEFNMYHFNTGDELRAEIKKNTPLSNKINQVISSGNLLSDDMINEFVASRIKDLQAQDKSLASRRILFDGYPRTAGQAIFLDKFLKSVKRRVSNVIEIKVDNDVLFQRIESRLVCSHCGTLYDITSKGKNKNAKMKCAVCGSEQFEKRPDDNADAIKKRINIYNEEIKGIIEYYDEKSLLMVINGDRDVNSVFNSISSLLINQ